MAIVVPSHQKRDHIMPQARLARPTSRQAFIWVMNKHASETVSWAEMIEAGFYEGDLLVFRARYFPGRKRVTLGELVPFVRYAHNYWTEVLTSLALILRSRKILFSNYYALSSVRRPYNSLPLQYFVGKGARPTSLKQLADIASEHGQQRITWADAVRAEACNEGLEEFQRRHFPGRRQLTLGELVPFLRCRHELWPDLVEVVMTIMSSRGILVAGYYESFTYPRRPLPAKYYVE